MSVTYEFMVDWDSELWTATPDFSEAIDNITPYVKNKTIDRGEDQELGNSPAGVLEITLNNESKRFSPTYAGPLLGKMRPWLPVRARATVNGNTQDIYTGFISRISVNPHQDVREAYLYCTDGMDLLARNMVTEDKTEPATTSDGEAVGLLLDAAGWPANKRNLDTDGGNIMQYPRTTEY